MLYSTGAEAGTPSAGPGKADVVRAQVASAIISLQYYIFVELQ